MNESGLTVELRYVPDCPLVDRVRTDLDDCLRQAGLSVTVREREGPYPSPTLLIDGIDVATGTPPTGDACCRLQLPTPDQIDSALRRRGTS